MKRLPNWIGIGCVKCGTSWAWKELWKHPQIYTPCKELNYFNYTSLFPLSVYTSSFEGGDEDQLHGEWTPDYFHHYEAIHNIKEVCPWVKMIVIFRHPVERAFSNYKHALFEGRIKPCTFNESFNEWRVSQRSIYSTWLKKWYNLFPKEQIKIMWYEDIKKDHVQFMKEIYQFLGINDSIIADNEQFKFEYQSDTTISEIKLSNKDRKQWLKYYKSSTNELQEMTGRNLSHWKI